MFGSRVDVVHRQFFFFNNASFVAGSMAEREPNLNSAIVQSRHVAGGGRGGNSARAAPASREGSQLAGVASTRKPAEETGNRLASMGSTRTRQADPPLEHLY
ncbi:hypothetical protein EVAR_75173_1 [Eumeta japonica]|uniref:Uncharacterized protein n=1 Tax=Eumeta variegata TaxID=151549 RepID=A0A4C1U0V7_EUMVA|nr:hypothetical protein EVAR_75173_1 [Eumeta japonica]